MSSAEVQIHFGKPSYGKVPVTIDAPGLHPFTDEVRIASEESRITFVANVTEKMPGIDKGEFLAQLEAEAARLSRDAGTKDKEADKNENKLQGRALTFEEPDPWPNAVDGAELVCEIQELLARYVILPPDASLTAAVWVIQTYCVDFVAVFPYLALQSPEKRCGKTRLLTVLERLVRRPLSASNASSAAIFRSLEQWRPTLVIDEVDSFLKGDEELRGILNAGHGRGGFVLRAVPVGDDFEARQFAVWGPKILCGIGQLPDTIQDRSIALPLARKESAELVERLRPRMLEERTGPLRRKIIRWIADNGIELENANPSIPEQLDDRAADCWEALFVVADLMDLGNEVRAAAVALSANREDEGSHRIRLLKDIRNIFAAIDRDRVSSAELVDALNELEEAPWNDWRHGNALNVNGLARLLRNFGIRSSNVRLPGAVQRKGYRKTDFDDAWNRYCPVVARRLDQESSFQADSSVPPSQCPRGPETRRLKRDASESVPSASEETPQDNGTLWDGLGRF